MKFNKIFLTLILLLAGNIVFADVFSNPVSVEKIMQDLPNFGDVACKFKQEKTMPGTTTTLKSGGDFQFTKSEGAVFKTTWPIQAVSTYKTSENKQINNIIISISNKNYSQIKKDFDLFFEKQNDKWTLALVPKKESRPAKQLEHIVIQGSKNINVITVNTKNSGKTIMMFEYS